MKILLVEDNPGDARLIEEMIKEVEGTTHFELVHVKSLGEALQSLGANSFDSILLDLGLPDSSGLNTLIKVHTEAPEMPIVVLTGLADEAVSAEALRQGAQDYLVKGRVDSNVLVRAMRYATQSKGKGNGRQP
jgi:DNA-binding response OmpR family regulator